MRGRESLSRTRLKIWVLFLHHFRSVPVDKNNNHGVSVLVTLPMTSLHWRILLCLTFFFFLEEDQSHLLCVFSYRPKPQHLMWQEHSIESIETIERNSVSERQRVCRPQDFVFLSKQQINVFYLLCRSHCFELYIDNLKYEAETKDPF